jgi:NAD(P)H-dependent flavin oxidoreductase YrpB (nitropropane dioxygenase family)
MAGGPTTAALVWAAAQAGSWGFLPGGYRTAAQLTEDLAAVRSRTEDFGVNLFVPDRTPVDRNAVLRYRDALADEVSALGADLGPERFEDDDDWDAKVDLLVREPVPWVSFTFGLPDASAVQRLRAAGSRLLMTVTAVDEARAAADLDPDGLVVQSAEAGGHRGTFDQQRTPDADELADLVAAVAGTVGLPVVAAGGIADRVGVRRALDAGAEAVAVGTALLLADEAGTRPVHRAAITDPRSTTTTTRAYTGRVARGLRTDFIDRFGPLAPAAYPAVHHLTAPMRRWAAEHGDREHLHLWAGTGFRSARPGSTGELLTGLMP